MMPSSNSLMLEVTVELEEIEKEQVLQNTSVYVFNRRLLIAKRLLKQDLKDPKIGKATFELNFNQGQLIVKVAPDVKDISELERCEPFVDRVPITSERKAKVAIKLPKAAWWCWQKVAYWATGNVVKDELDHTAPICIGEVDIYDVDIGRCIMKLPDSIIEMIRNGLIDLVVNPPPIKIEENPIWAYADDDDDWCATKPKRPFPPKGIDIISKLDSLPPAWTFSRQRFAALSTSKARMSAELEKMTLIERQAFLDRESMQGVKISQLIHTNTAQLRDLMVKQFQAFRFWLCMWPWIYWIWWPYCRRYSLEMLGTASLKPDGSFSSKIWLPICRGDLPDLWFVVRQKINGIERKIFRRYPVPCNTYWNHPSGKSVKLVVTDSTAFACNEDPETDLDPAHLWVVPLAIGSYSLKKIYGTGAGTLPKNNTDPDVGLYESISTGLAGTTLSTFSKGPFGGMLGLRYLFSPELEIAGVKYYRIKYRVNGAGEWMPLTSEVVRHYTHYNASADSLEFPSYRLGPNSVGSQNALFEIPPKNTPNYLTEPLARWEVVNPYVDLINGYLDSNQMTTGATTSVSYGLVEFKLELFNASGNRINPASFMGGISFKLPANDDVWDTITTADPSSVNPDLVGPDPEDAAFQAFTFRLRVDNRQPTASIPEPLINPSGNKAGNCGVMHYLPADESVQMTYEATHPAKFGMYKFDLYRGPQPLHTEEGGTASSGYFTFGEANPSWSQIPDLLDGCAEAAFSENLYIWNMAFDGWSRLGPDASAVRAFALAKK